MDLAIGPTIVLYGVIALVVIGMIWLLRRG